MAEETFNQLYERYNTDDVFNRVVIIGLLDLLNHKLKYDQIWDDNVVEEVVVPFMYDFGSSDERFAQDNYTFFGTTCFNEKKITGKFDMLPRGSIKYTGSAIDSGNITNRFIQGTFLKNENGKFYVSFEPLRHFPILTKIYYEWDAEDEVLMIKSYHDKVSYWTIGKDTALIDGKEVKLSKPVEMFDGLPYLPLDEFCAAADCTYEVIGDRVEIKVNI